MSDEREQILQEEITNLEERTRILASKMQELMGIDCSFGSCVFDPEVEDVEEKIGEVQRKKKVLEDIMKELDQIC